MSHPETVEKRKLVAAFRLAEHKAWAVENLISTGMPDVLSISWYDLRASWIEVKYVPRVPRRKAVTPMLGSSHKASAEQRGFLYDFWRFSPGRSWIAASDSVDWYLLPGLLALDANLIPAEQWQGPLALSKVVEVGHISK